MTIASGLPSCIRFGTRGSALALAQTERVIRQLTTLYPDVATEVVIIRTEGDFDKTSPLTVIGGRGVFTSALQDALRRGEIDAAVHSAKDLPSDEPAGLALVAFPEREDPRDVLISRHDLPLAALPPNPVIGTSSRRRALQVRLQRPDARIVELRGNVDTRLRKALETEVDAIVLAAAGLRRLGWAERITELLPLDQFVPSPGQGALAVETRADDAALVALLTELDDPLVAAAVRAERAFLRAVGAGCTMPVGAHVARGARHWNIWAMAVSEDGYRCSYTETSLRIPHPDLKVAAHRLASEMTHIGRQLVANVQDHADAPSGLPPHRINGGSATARPLAGVRVLVTRARTQAAPLVAALRAVGAMPLELPTIRIEDPCEVAPLDAALERLAAGGYDWLVFSSANAVDQVAARLDTHLRGRGVLNEVRIAAVGSATANALAGAGAEVDLVAEPATAEAVVAALNAREIAGRRVLYPKGDLARDVIETGLAAAGATVEAIVAYRTVPESDVDPAIVAELAQGLVDIVIVASPSSLRNLVALLGGTNPLTKTAMICVGPVTAGAVRELGLEVAAVAAEASTAGLVEAVVAYHADHPTWKPGRVH